MRTLHRAPHQFTGIPWGEGGGWEGGKGSPFHGAVCFALMPKPCVPGTGTSPQGALIWLTLPSSAQTDSPSWLLEGAELRFGILGVHVILAQTVVFSSLPPAIPHGLVPLPSSRLIP